MDIIAKRSRQLSGNAKVPGDKSMSHRCIMLGALAEGVTQVTGLLEGEDVLATVAAFRAMGVSIERQAEGEYRIEGVGLHGLKPSDGALDMGNSGTAMRLLSGVLAGQNFDTVLMGDDSLSKRPMRRVSEPLSLMGAVIDTGEGGTPPLCIRGSSHLKLKGIDYALPMASAQVKSAILLAGLYVDAAVTVREPAPTRDHTERMLRGFGCDIASDEGVITLRKVALMAQSIDIPADISSAAFFMVAASIIPDSDILLQHVGINPTRTGVIDILQLMGADIELLNPSEAGGEPVADIRVKYRPLHGIDIPESLVPLAIDEFPVVFVAAACAQGVTRLTGAEELRFKESDRIATMAEGLTALGMAVTPREDGIEIIGGALQGGSVQSYGDHRIAMAFIIAGAVAETAITVGDCSNIDTSFPEFMALARALGLEVQHV